MCPHIIYEASACIVERRGMHHFCIVHPYCVAIYTLRAKLCRLPVYSKATGYKMPATPATPKHNA